MDTRPILNIKSLKGQVYEYLRDQMKSGQLMPGSVIDMEETSKKLGVSKTPLRDALLQLEMEDFVTILPRRKIIVNVLTIQNIKNYYEIIGALESTALLAALDVMRDGDIAAMEKLNEAMKKAIAAGDFDLYYEKNLQYHDIYLDLCGNANLGKIVNLMKKRLYDFPRQSRFVKEWEEVSIREHQHLLDLIKSGKKLEAVGYIRDIHWSFKVQEQFITKYYTDIA